MIRPRGDRPLIMGVLNVTPDSFSDGGEFLDVRSAIDHGRRLVEEGADIVDVGGESTRPGAPSVNVQTELSRVVPVIEGLVKHETRISIDTSKPQVAAAALNCGAQFVNDVTGLRDPEMVDVCAKYFCEVCIMHMQGDPRTMQSSPSYGDVVAEVAEYLRAQAAHAETCGIMPERIWIDPGIGFGKTLQQNLALLNHIGELSLTGYPVLIGVSRKSFLGKITGIENPKERLSATVSAEVLAFCGGAQMIRTHNVRATHEALQVAEAILEAQR